MVIRMKYPLKSNILNFDGRIHQIRPTKLKRAKDSNFYIMDYYDISLGKEMVTILKKEGSTFYKVPLLDYSHFMFFKFKFTESCDLRILPEFIDCGKFSTKEEIIQEISNPRVNEPLVRSKKSRIIYYNDYDKKYYWDEACKKEIKDAPNSLGKLSEDGAKIIGTDFDYLIKFVYVRNNNYNFELENNRPLNDVSHKYKKKVVIFFNTFDRKYYWDKDCKEEIKDAPNSLGELSEDGITITGVDFDYSIQYVYSILLKGRQEELKPEEPEEKSRLKEPYTTSMLVLYDEEKHVFYIAEYIISNGETIPTHTIDGVNISNEFVDVRYTLPFSMEPNTEDVLMSIEEYEQGFKYKEGKFLRVPEVDIDEELKSKLLERCIRTRTNIVGKTGIVKVKILKDKDGNKYICSGNITSASEILIKSSTSGYIPVKVISYSPELRIRLESKFQEEVVYEEHFILTKQKNELGDDGITSSYHM